MSAAAYVGGLACFVVIWGSALAAATVISRRRLGHLRGAPFVLALALLTTLGLLVICIVPMLFGVLTRGTAVVAALLVLGGSLLVPAQRASDVEEWPGDTKADRQRDPLSRALAAVALAIVLLIELTVLRQNWTLPALGLDALNFHLPDVAGWIQTGSIWQVGQFTPDLANGNYPNNGNVIWLATILPWHADFLVRFAMLPFGLLTGVGVYGLARELRAPRTASLIYSAVFLALPAVAYDLLQNTLPDVVLSAMFATGLLFLVRHWRTGARSDFVLAGLAFGVGFGTKWFGVTSVAAVLAIWVVASLLARRGVARVVKDLAGMIALVLLAGGVWLIRNWVVSGNPVFPAKVAPLGITLIDAPRDQIREIAGKRIVDYASDGHAWTQYFFPAWLHSLGWAGPLLVAGALVALAVAIKEARRWQATRETNLLVIAAGIAFVLLTLVYVDTPYTAFGNGKDPIFAFVNVRYEEPALVVAAALTAWAAGAVLGLRVLLEAAGAVATYEAAHRGLAIGPADVAKAAIAATLVIALIVGVALLPRLRAQILARRALLAGLALVVALGVAAYGEHFQKTFAADRYTSGEEVTTWITQHAPSGHRIALAGYWDARTISPVYPAFGPRFGNHVAFVGPHRRGFLRSYFTRTAFMNALRVGRYDLLVVGLTPGGLKGAPQGRDFARWVKAAGWKRATGSRYLALYRR